MDRQSHRPWYARAAIMLPRADPSFAPEYVVHAEKKRARLNCISHFLGLIPDIGDQTRVKPPKRQKPHVFVEPKNRRYNKVPEVLCFATGNGVRIAVPLGLKKEENERCLD